MRFRNRAIASVTFMAAQVELFSFFKHRIIFLFLLIFHLTLSIINDLNFFCKSMFSVINQQTNVITY
jgi:hypothetical protein